ncbi:MAG TPA: PAC2 family protein [Solirubrobacteraceae bacterium]|jgi:predicted ATP-grasp superfamily ATP-dependent carboligase|nr:PAC2 family protein [Solirubrobacteraceae bacterium]
MQPLIWDHRPSGLRAPIMVCAFEGWNDAGDAASAAVDFMSETLHAEVFAQVDIEEFYDFQLNRPRIQIVEGERREIEWPCVQISAAEVPHARQDLVFVHGHEPSLRWRTFGRLIAELAEALDVQLVVTLGALLADVPHTHPVAMTGFASEPKLMRRLGTARAGSYEGPTGIIGVLHSAIAEAGLPAVSLWASVPHYVAAAPSPKAALALVRRLEGLLGVAFDASDLERAAENYERQVGLAVSSDPDVQAFVERLERDAESETELLSPEELPSGDLLARQFQRFLRQRGPDGPRGS